MQENQPWWVIIVAGLPALVVTLWQTHRGSSDKREERASNERERLRLAMDTATLAAFDRLEKEILRERTRREEAEKRADELERRMDRGWDIARLWRGRARELRHDFMGLRQQVLVYVPDEKKGLVMTVPPPLEELDEIREV